MLEGKELEGKIGSVGSYEVDVTPELKLKIAIGAEVDLVGELKKLAEKTDTPMDDLVIAWLEKLAAAAKVVS
jgi:hypothetical protein